jgi:hypothetical protein
MRDSKIKHGACAQNTEEALRALGEDPKDFEALLESPKASWQPANALEELQVRRLARAVWRTERNDCLGGACKRAWPRASVNVQTQTNPLRQLAYYQQDRLKCEKQTHKRYPPCCQLLTANLTRFFKEFARGGVRLPKRSKIVTNCYHKVIDRKLPA